VTQDGVLAHYELQGRVLACEIVQRGLLNLMACAYEPHDPVAMLALFERKLIEAMQHMEVPIGPEVDVVWSSAGAAVRQSFVVARQILMAGGSARSAD